MAGWFSSGKWLVRGGWVAGILILSTACSGGTPTADVNALPKRMEAGDAAHQALSEVLSELDYDLDQGRAFLEAFAATPEVQGSDGEQCATQAATLLKQNPADAQIGATDLDGTLFCDTDSNSRRVSVADRLYYQRAIQTKDFSVGEFLIGQVTPAPSMGMAYPILDENKQIHGTVFAPLSLNWLAMRISETNIPVTGEILLIDSYGNILLRDPDSDQWVGKNISETPIGNAMLTKYQGSGKYAGADWETWIDAFAPPQSLKRNLIAAVGIKE